MHLGVWFHVISKSTESHENNQKRFNQNNVLKCFLSNFSFHDGTLFYKSVFCVNLHNQFRPGLRVYRTAKFDRLVLSPSCYIFAVLCCVSLTAAGSTKARSSLTGTVLNSSRNHVEMIIHQRR